MPALFDDLNRLKSYGGNESNNRAARQNKWGKSRREFDGECIQRMRGRVIVVIEVREPRTVGHFREMAGRMKMVEMCVDEFGVVVIRSAVDMLERRQKERHQQCDAGLRGG
jgi:hypothetical protein